MTIGRARYTSRQAIARFIAAQNQSKAVTRESLLTSVAGNLRRLGESLSDQASEALRQGYANAKSPDH